MQFTYPITVEPSTEESDPERLQVKLCIGTLKKVWVYFPWGCAGYVGVRILHYEHQLFPTNLDEWFIGNEILIEFECEYLIMGGTNEFKIEAYNEDDFYPHTPIVGFNILRGGLFIPESTSWVEA